MQKVEKNGLPLLAVDLGGTKILATLISAEGKILARKKTLTLANAGAQPVINRMLTTIDQLLSQENISPSRLDSISIAAAGTIDMDSGVVTLSPQIPGWRNIPLRDIVQKKYGIPTFLINDASAAALSEHRLGAGKGINNLIYITLSTGIGGGIIIDDKLYLGANGGAGELGHITIDANGARCTCGNIGCWQMLASGTAVADEAARRIGQGEGSSLCENTDGMMGKITAEKVEMAARGGDSLAREVISRAAIHLGVGMVNLIHLFNPAMIIVGGGMSKMSDLLLQPAREVIRERAHRLSAQAVQIVTSQLGADAGVLGAAVFARQQGNGHGGHHEGS
ncbi:ROK family protein [Chloroflexota bacterium]